MARKERDSRGRAFFEPEVGRYILDHSWGRWLPDLTRDVNGKFGTHYTTKHIKSYKKNHRISSGLDGQFKKGGSSPVKGRPQKDWMSPEVIERTKATRFKKGNIPHNTAPLGKETVRHFADGSIAVFVKVEMPNKWKQKSRIVWEAANGPIPRGKMIAFRDSNPLNCELSNLVCVSHDVMAYANLTHYRQVGGEAGLKLAETELALAKKLKEIKKNVTEHDA